MFFSPRLVRFVKTEVKSIFIFVFLIIINVLLIKLDFKITEFIRGILYNLSV